MREVLSRGGRPLPETLRGPMEERYRFDFSKVRVHHDREADDAARSVGAHAFTSGSHVVLRSGIDLQSGSGREVLAHELAHVIQQGRGQRPASWIDGGAADPLEREADAMAAGDHAGPSPDGPAGVVQRDEDDSAPPAAPPARDPSRFEQALTRLASMARLVPGLGAVADVIDVIRTAVDLWRRREELLQRLLDAIGTVGAVGRRGEFVREVAQQAGVAGHATRDARLMPGQVERAGEPIEPRPCVCGARRTFFPRAAVTRARIASSRS